MMKTVLFIGFAISFSAIVQAAPSILVYHDVADGYGDAVLQAIDELWPACYLDVYTGLAEQSSFNNALETGQWDVVILECWVAPTDDIDWYEVREVYLFDEAEIFVYNWHFWGSSSGQFPLYMAMGIEDVVPSQFNTLIEIWEPDHALVQGISNWEQYSIFPGGGGSIIRRIELVHGDDTIPVAGWVENYGGGICVASDGESVVSGFCPAYAVEAVAIWKNILNFLWDSSPVQQSTWAEIKSTHFMM